MRVLLVQPPTHSNVGLQAFNLPEPLGLEAVAATLIDGHEVDILDMRLDCGLRNKLRVFRPNAVGVSASFTADVYSVYEALDVVREYNDGIRTFVGGNHATMCHADFNGRADAVVVGEGELTAPELLSAWEQDERLDDVPGIAFRRSDGWMPTQPRPLIEDLDETPLPARHLVAKYRDHYFLGTRRPCASVETSRGCPYRCNFCAVWRFYRGSYRTRSAERVARELGQVDTPHVLFVDDNFLAAASRAEKILRAIRELSIKKGYVMQVRADSIVSHRDLVGRWASSGLDAAFVGFEAISQEKLDGLGKRLEPSTNEDAINTLHELGILAMASFIVDTDFKREDFAALRRFVRRMKLRQPYFTVLTPLPGTALHEARAGELTSDNFELYDLLHAVLPTALGLKRFYREYVRLWLSSYVGNVSPRGLRTSLGDGLGAFLRTISTTVKLLLNCNPWALIRHHRRAPLPLR